MPLLALVLHEVELWGWRAGALQALAQLELLCPRALLGADNRDLESRERPGSGDTLSWGACCAVNGAHTTTVISSSEKSSGFAFIGTQMPQHAEPCYFAML